MKKSIILNSDRILLYLLPSLIIILLLSFTDEALFFSILIVLGIISYSIIIYSKNLIYGIAGLRILSVPSLIIASYTVFIAIPCIFISIANNGQYVAPFFFSVLQFYILYPLGLLFSGYFFKLSNNDIQGLYYSPFEKSSLDKYLYEILLLVLITSIGILVIYFLRVKVIPLFVMISNPKAYLYLWTLREEALKILNVSFMERYLFSWLRGLFFPFGIIGSLFLFMRYYKKKYLLLFCLFLSLGLLNNSLTIAKAPTAALLLSLVAYAFLLKKSFGFGTILLSIIFIFSFPSLVIHLTNLPENRDPLNLLTSMLLRIFFIPAEALYQYFEVFPDHHQFLYGRGSNLFSWIFGEGTFDVSNFVAQFWWNDRGTTGYANAIFLGNFWADFGFFGVMSSSFLIGVFAQYFYYKTLMVSRYRKNCVYVTVTCSLIMIFSFSFVSANFTTLLISKGLLIVLIFLHLMDYISKQLNLNN